MPVSYTHLDVYKRQLLVRSKPAQKVLAVGEFEAQPLRNQRAKVRVPPGALQPVTQQGGDDRRAFDQSHRTAQTGQHKGVAAQPGGRIDHGRRGVAFQTYRPSQRLVATCLLYTSRCV